MTYNFVKRITSNFVFKTFSAVALFLTLLSLTSYNLTGYSLYVCKTSLLVYTKGQILC